MNANTTHQTDRKGVKSFAWMILLLIAALTAGCEPAAEDEELVVVEVPAEAAEETPAPPEMAAQCPPAEPAPMEEAPAPTPSRRALNLYDRQDNLYAWRKTRGSLNPDEDVVFYWVGSVYNVVAKDPEDYTQRGGITFEEPLFRFEGFNVARIAEVGPDDYMMLSREVSVYQDPRTGRPLDCWRNTLLEGSPKVSVMHVANDPVNFGVGNVEFMELGNRVSFFSDVLLAYRSPLAGNTEYADYSAGDVYQSNELFNFYASRDDLENEDLDSVPVEISWTRVGQYLPWMQMGDLPGQLVYHVRGYKLPNGIDDLPPSLREWTETAAGETFLRAPEEVPLGYSPNATTWRVFKSQFDAGNYTPDCR